MSGLPLRTSSIAFAILSLLLMTTAPSPADAHGGYPVLDGRDGSYAVLVQASRAAKGDKSAIDLTAYLTRQDLGEPDLGAAVTLRIRTEDGRTSVVRPELVGDGYQAIVPGRPGSWRGWRIEATVEGTAGRSVITADPLDDYDGIPGWLWSLLVGIVLLAAAGSLVVIRRRLRSTPDDEGPGYGP